jgi:hypothetical protein
VASNSCRSLRSNAPHSWTRCQATLNPMAARVGVHGYDVLAAVGVRQSQRLAASAAANPDAVRVPVRHPHISTAAAASGKGSNLALSPRESDDGGDSVTASQVLLSPLPPRTVSYICDWAQARLGAGNLL